MYVINEITKLSECKSLLYFPLCEVLVCYIHTYVIHFETVIFLFWLRQFLSSFIYLRTNFFLSLYCTRITKWQCEWVKILVVCETDNITLSPHHSQTKYSSWSIMLWCCLPRRLYNVPITFGSSQRMSALPLFSWKDYLKFFENQRFSVRENHLYVVTISLFPLNFITWESPRKRNHVFW